ncbi:MAG: hypothetical protein WD066_07260 [Planctomycetaceae bacterium]
MIGDVKRTQLLDEHYRKVIGRCGDVSIRVGDRFDFLVRFREPGTIADYEREPIETSREEVSLVVEHIRAYDRDRDMLDRGMTGSLVLTGQGLDRLGGTCSLLAMSPLSARSSNGPEGRIAAPNAWETPPPADAGGSPGARDRR